MLADSRALRLMDGRQYADHAKQRSRKIGERHTDAHRRIIRAAGRNHHSTERLDDRVHCFTRARFTLAAKTGDRAIDNARIHFLRERVAGAEALQRAPAEIFDDHVGGLYQVGINPPRFGMFQIQRHTQLVAKPVESGHGNIVGMPARERPAFRSKVGRIGAAGIAAADRVLDLDDLGPQARQQQRGERTSQRRG